MVGEMGAVVYLGSRLHLNRLHEINKKKRRSLLGSKLYSQNNMQREGEEGFRREYYSPRTEDLNWRWSQRVYWASGMLVLAD